MSLSGSAVREPTTSSARFCALCLVKRIEEMVEPGFHESLKVCLETSAAGGNEG